MDDAIRSGLYKAGIARATRHLFVCLGPDCCRTDEGETLWEFIKQRVRETGITVMRTKAACFRICAGGPWMVVYPEGTWYGAVTPERFERILQEHLIGGTPIREWIVAENNLVNSTTPPTPPSLGRS